MSPHTALASPVLYLPLPAHTSPALTQPPVSCPWCHPLQSTERREGERQGRERGRGARERERQRERERVRQRERDRERETERDRERRDTHPDEDRVPEQRCHLAVGSLADLAEQLLDTQPKGCQREREREAERERETHTQ